MPELKIDRALMEVFGKAGCEYEMQQILFIVHNNWQVPNETYSNLVRVLAEIQKVDRLRGNQFYFKLQEFIRAYFAAQGSHLFSKKCIGKCVCDEHK